MLTTWDVVGEGVPFFNTKLLFKHTDKSKFENGRTRCAPTKILLNLKICNSQFVNEMATDLLYLTRKLRRGAPCASVQNASNT